MFLKKLNSFIILKNLSKSIQLTHPLLVDHNVDTFHDLHWVDTGFVVVDIVLLVHIDLEACNYIVLDPGMVYL